MKHAEFHYLDAATIARDFPTRPGLGPDEAFALAEEGRGRGPFMARIELACLLPTPWPHTLGQIVASADGRVWLDPWLTDGRPSWYLRRNRLHLDCQACRRAGRTLQGTLDVTDLLGLAAWMSTTRDEYGDQPRRVEIRRLVALPDEVERHTAALAERVGHEDARQRRERMELRSRLIAGCLAQGDTRNRA